MTLNRFALLISLIIAPVVVCQAQMPAASGNGSGPAAATRNGPNAPPGRYRLEPRAPAMRDDGSLSKSQTNEPLPPNAVVPIQPDPMLRVLRNAQQVRQGSSTPSPPAQ